MTIGQNETRRKTLAFFIGPRWANKKEKASLKTRLAKFFYDIGIKKNHQSNLAMQIYTIFENELLTRNILSEL